MEVKNIKSGDKIEIQTKEKIWVGNFLESYDYEIVLLKLKSGYNIGIRKNEIIKIKTLEKVKEVIDEKLMLETKKELKNVAMIITGGTISSRLDPKTGAVKWTTVEDLFKIAPEIFDICNVVKIKKPFMKGSEDMSLKYWKKIANETYELLIDENIDGVIITHGTDTLHYGSSALAFFLQNLNKPIAFTYSQRSIDRASTDAHLNLICAAKYAVSDIAEIAVVGHKDLNDNLCYALPATKCRKMHTSRRDAFKPINTIPIAEISKEHIEILNKFKPRNNLKPKLDTKYNDKVVLIKFIPGQDPDILDYYAKKGYKGIILETTGLGHLAGKASEKNWLSKIKKLISKGVIICAVPQTIYGQLNPNVYSSGRELKKTGILYLKDILPETAFVKLSWILGHKSWVYNDKSVAKKMLVNYANEFNDRIKPDQIGF